MNQRERKLIKRIENSYKKAREDIHNRMFGLWYGEKMIEDLQKLFKIANKK